VAETGSTSSFVSEANDAISAGTALDVEIGAGGFDSPGSQTVTIDMNSEFPQVTFLSMIAPSPDWIGGAHVNNLLTSDGFADSLTVDVMAYDAGTDSGKQYRSANLATNPRDVIQALITDPADASFTSAAQQKIGTLTFIKQ